MGWSPFAQREGHSSPCSCTPPYFYFFRACVGRNFNSAGVSFHQKSGPSPWQASWRVGFCHVLSAGIFAGCVI